MTVIVAMSGMFLTGNSLPSVRHRHDPCRRDRGPRLADRPAGAAREPRHLVDWGDPGHLQAPAGRRLACVGLVSRPRAASAAVSWVLAARPLIALSLPALDLRTGEPARRAVPAACRSPRRSRIQAASRAGRTGRGRREGPRVTAPAVGGAVEEFNRAVPPAGSCTGPFHREPGRPVAIVGLPGTGNGPDPFEDALGRCAKRGPGHDRWVPGAAPRHG